LVLLFFYRLELFGQITIDKIDFMSQEMGIVVPYFVQWFGFSLFNRFRAIPISR
jgi:hypothetical protein